MNVSVSLTGTFALSISAFANLCNIATAQQAPIDSQQTTQTIAQKICAFDAVENLLPPLSEQTNSLFSYLAQQGFTQNPDGSWVCYASTSGKPGRYYTLFKVQEIDRKVVASSFLENGQLIEGQDKRTLDLFMMLIQNHTNTNQGNLESILQYLEAFMTLLKQGKILPSERGYLFDQPSRGFVIYNRLLQGQIKGTAITINIDIAQKLLK